MNFQSMVTITQTVVTFSAHCSLLVNPDSKPLLCLSSVHAFPECVTRSTSGDLVPVGIGKAQLRFSSVQEKNNGLTYVAPLPKGSRQSSSGQDGQGVKQPRDPPSLLPKASGWAHSRAGIHRCPCERKAWAPGDNARA